MTATVELAARVAQACEPACQRGHGTCCHWLGMHSVEHWLGMHLLEKAKGAPLSKVVLLLNRACELGELKGCLALTTRIYDEPHRRNEPLAISARRRACQLGATKECREAALDMVAPYEFEKREELASRATDALAMFSSACQTGDPIACLYAAGLSDSRDLPTHELTRATRLLDQACQLGDDSACTRRMTRRAIGRGVPADREGALADLDQACAAKVEMACRTAKVMRAPGPHPWDECTSGADCVLGSGNCDSACPACWQFLRGLNGKWAAAANRDCNKRRTAERLAASRRRSARPTRPTCSRCPDPPRVLSLLQPTGVACVSHHCVPY